MKTITQYWADMKSPIPANAFDFISIHKNDDGYQLISPLCLISLVDGVRPEFERVVHRTLEAARLAAVAVVKASGLKIKIVYCKRGE